MGASGRAKESHHPPPNSAKKAEAEAYAASPEGKAKAAQAEELRAEEKRREALLNAQTKGLMRVRDQDDIQRDIRKATHAAEEAAEKAAAADLRLASAQELGLPTDRIEKLEKVAVKAAAKADAAAKAAELVVARFAAGNVSCAN